MKQRGEELDSAEPRPVEAQSEFEDSYHDRLEIRGAILTEPLGSVRRRPLNVVPDTLTVDETIQTMVRHRCGYALIVHDGKLAGILTERDVLTKVAANRIDTTRTPVRDVMTKDPDTLPASATIDFALRKMSVEGYRHIPLVDAEQRPVGVVAMRDIINWMVELFPRAVLNLPPEPGYPKSIDGG